MKISVIVPVYNVEKYIERCMDSLVNQTLEDIEIIVVNDGSTDNTAKIIEEKYQDPRIKMVYKKNKGVGSARNSGVQYARGEYLYFVDGDDFLSKSALEEMYEVAKRGDYDLIYTDYFKYFSKEDYDALPITEHYKAANLKTLITSIPTASCRLIKRDLFKKSKLKFLEGYYFEDNAIIPLLGTLAKNPHYYRKAVYYYFQRNGSILNKQQYDKKWEDIFYALKYLKEKFIEYKVYDEYKEELEFIYIEYLLHAANLRFLDYKEGQKNIKRVHDVMKSEFPKYRRNKYFKEENYKYRIMCNLFYHRQILIIKLIKKIRRSQDA